MLFRWLAVSEGGISSTAVIISTIAESLLDGLGYPCGDKLVVSLMMVGEILLLLLLLLLLLVGVTGTHACLTLVAGAGDAIWVVKYIFCFKRVFSSPLSKEERNRNMWKEI